MRISQATSSTCFLAAVARHAEQRLDRILCDVLGAGLRGRAAVDAGLVHSRGSGAGRIDSLAMATDDLRGALVARKSQASARGTTSAHRAQATELPLRWRRNPKS